MTDTRRAQVRIHRGAAGMRRFGQITAAVAAAAILFPALVLASAGDNGIEKIVNGLTVELLVGAPPPASATTASP